MNHFMRKKKKNMTWKIVIQDFADISWGWKKTLKEQDRSTTMPSEKYWVCVWMCVCVCTLMSCSYSHLHDLINYCREGMRDECSASLPPPWFVCSWFTHRLLTHYLMCFLVELCLCAYGAAGYKVLFTNACMPSVSTAAERKGVKATAARFHNKIITL